jgi:hypothetical protein
LKSFRLLPTTKAALRCPEVRGGQKDLSRRHHLHAPAHGTSEARGEIVHDDIVGFELMTDTLDRPWWDSYRRRLEQSFSQDEIVIRAVAITRL